MGGNHIYKKITKEYHCIENFYPNSFLRGRNCNTGSSGSCKLKAFLKLNSFFCLSYKFELYLYLIKTINKDFRI